MQAISRKQTKLQSVGESIASAISQQLQPNFRVVASSTPMEWEIVDGQGVYHGGFCHDESWFQLCPPLPDGQDSDVPNIPLELRRKIASIVWGAIREAG
jgi:hypothetical protein